MSKQFVVGVLLAIFGVVSSLVLFSISRSEAVGQLTFATLGILVYIIVLRLPRRLMLRGSLALYLVVLALLIFTFVRGHSAKGASRWFSVGPVRVQVSELAKPVLALTLAAFMVQFTLTRQRHIATFLLLAGLYVGGVFIEPDLGSSLVLGSIAGAMVFMGVGRLTLLLPWVAAGVVVLLLSWNFLLHSYQKERLFSFFGQETQSGSSYNARQSVITFGSGKVWGRGIGHGVQTALRFLPEHHTDFFFASYAEETGFVGVLMVFVLYAVLFFVLVSNSGSLAAFDQIFRYGLVGGLFFQFAVHVCMNMGIAPVTGIPLPFLSSGGSSFISLALFVALGMRFDKEKTKKAAFHTVGDRDVQQFASFGNDREYRQIG